MRDRGIWELDGKTVIIKQKWERCGVLFVYEKHTERQQPREASGLGEKNYFWKPR